MQVTPCGHAAPVVSASHGHATTTSKAVADYFHKSHKDVLRKIEALLPDLPADFHQRNFAPMGIKVEIGLGKTRTDPAYEITRDGFTLLAMGFTGKQALQWKLRYIEAFNAMEARLRQVGGSAADAGAEGEASLQDGEALRLIDADLQALYTNVGILRKRANRLAALLVGQLQESALQAVGEPMVALSRPDWLALQMAVDNLQLSLHTWFSLLQDDVVVVSEQHLPLLRLEVARLQCAPAKVGRMPVAGLLAAQYVAPAEGGVAPAGTDMAAVHGLVAAWVAQQPTSRRVTLGALGEALLQRPAAALTKVDRSRLALALRAQGWQRIRSGQHAGSYRAAPRRRGAG